ncbi:protein phosphatase 1 regulatory subunit 15A [Echinops telfairi]|uniref:Protein phosphatase 1 regulatory subunit 15A n=2 Tax=Echinops telfairi TaxID=9371 RepID=A0ABM0IYD1_ECHTE|nr:protein phosphatase 1 regulatory subunit 15A [Echinops telfairi]XP_045148683.1 protein phosphatase 1 regulatory subunit 15A [Echinops telfairi]
MAPKQGPPLGASFFLSPLVGILNRAWSRLRGPGPPEPWGMEVASRKAALDVETELSLALGNATWSGHPYGEAEDKGLAEDNNGAADLKAPTSLVEASEVDREGCAEKEAPRVVREQGSGLVGSQPAPLPSGLPTRTPPDPLGEEQSEEEDRDTAVHPEMAKTFACPVVACMYGPRPKEEEAEKGKLVKEAWPQTTTCLFSPGPVPGAALWTEEATEGHKDEEDGAAEDREARKAAMASWWPVSHPRTGEYPSGKSKEEAAEKDGDPELLCYSQAWRSLLSLSLEAAPTRNTETEEGAGGEGGASGTTAEKWGAGRPFFIPSTRTFLRALVFWPGKASEKAGHEEGACRAAQEGGEAAAGPTSSPSVSPSSKVQVIWPGEEEEDSEDHSSGEAEGPSSLQATGAFLKDWVYWPGEEEEEEDEEDRDSEAAEEEGEAEWVYKPGEDSEEEEEEGEAEWIYKPGEDSEEEEEEGEAEWIYKPGEDSEEEEEEGEAEWIYKPGEDSEEEEEEDRASRAPEEEGEAEGLTSVPSTSTFLKNWVYRPGEDSEEEEDGDSGAVEEDGEAEGLSCLSSTSTFLKNWVYRPGEDLEEGEEENSDSEAALGDSTGRPHPPLQVAIYLPGEKPLPPWAPPLLPHRLQRRLESLQAPTPGDPDPETPQQARKVRFADKVIVHRLIVWAGPAQAVRRGPWEEMARDRSRFARRIARTQKELDPCFTPAARAKAWERLRDPPLSLAASPAPGTQTLARPSEAPHLAPPLSPTEATPSPSHCLALQERRG